MSSINNNGNVGGSVRPETSVPDTVPVQQLQTALSRISLDANEVQLDVNALLQRAGLERMPDGSMVVKDAASVGRTNETKGLSAAEKIYGSAETQLKPPSPPRIEITAELRRGAETFSRNLDTTFNEVLLKSSASSLSTGKLAVNGTPTAADAASAAKNLAALTPDQFKKLAELSADVLLAAFLKLNITDPNNNVDTQNRLQEIMTTLRQKGIDDAKKASANAQELRKNAEAYAQKAQIFSTLIQVVMIIVSLVLAAITFGAAGVLMVAVCMVVGALIGGMIGGKEGAMTGLSIGGAIGSFGAGAAANLAAQGVKVTLETVVKQMITMIKDMVKQLVQKLAGLFSKTAAEGATKIATQAISTAVKQMPKQALQIAERNAQSMFTKSLDELSQAELKQVVDATTKELANLMTETVKTTITTSLTETLKSSGKELTADAMKAIATEVEATMKTVAPQIADMAKGVVTSAIRDATSVISTTTADAIKMGVSSTGEIGKAEANNTTAQKLLDSQEADVEAKRMRLLAEMAQNQIQDSGEMIKVIMESKNNTVDAVTKMMSAMFASSQKLMSAGMAK